MDLYLIRHTRVGAAASTCYGRLDVPLAATCDSDCATVAARVPDVDAVWSSPLTRCRALASVLGNRFGMAPVTDARLAELDFGEWEGQRWDAIDRAASERWTADFWNVAPPHGESYRMLYERVGAVLEDIASSGARSIAVVTHAGPIRAALSRCLELEPQRYGELAVDYGSIAHLSRDGNAWRLECVHA